MSGIIAYIFLIIVRNRLFSRIRRISSWLKDVPRFYCRRIIGYMLDTLRLRCVYSDARRKHSSVLRLMEDEFLEWLRISFKY